ncbi:MAG: GspH/FimT family pseudopilin [Sphaerotilus sp.]|nr:GspH/FimT family pseudopilin [Sphaerotilus sp.]
MAMLSILGMVALPSLSAFSARNRLSALSSDFVSSLALARTEAARAGMPVLVLPADGGVTGNEFAQGWSLYLDRNSSGTADTGDTLLRTYPALPSALKLQGTSAIRFTALGYLTPAAAVDFVLCPRAGLRDGVQITVPPNGLADVTRITTCT